LHQAQADKAREKHGDAPGRPGNIVHAIDRRVWWS
jgi:hypothetical protein